MDLEGADFPRRKPMLLLAYLALEGTHSRAHLARLFWPGATDPANRLAVALRRVRLAAPEAVTIQNDRVQTRLQTDVHLLREALERNDADTAMTRYPGAFLDGVRVRGVGEELEAWILDTREELARRLRALLVRVAEQEASDGRFRDAAARAERARLLPGTAPAPPELLARMHALLTAGDASGAEVLRREAAEFGLTLAPGRARARASLRAARAPSTLPRPATSFVGRDDERLELGRVLGQRDRPLVTILGPGGTGKTRLALALAHDAHASDGYEGGVHYVSLEGVADPAAVAGVIAAALHVVPTRRESPRDALVRTLGAKRTLIVLDNVDDLVEGATAIADLLGACPGLTVLATSRRRLDIEEESVYPLTGLPVAPAGTDAMEDGSDADRLFVERAQRARLDYTPDQAERDAIRAICRLVEGSPLGIELAAVHLREGSAVEAEAVLRASFDAVATPSRNVPERHRTLRASFDVSWADLPASARNALRKLAVFRGGFDVDAAHDVCDVDASMLALLVDRSLVAAAGDGRYGLHPLVQAYAAERLMQDPDVRAELERRHARHVLAQARTWQAWFYGPRQAEAQARFEREHANLAAADAWALAHDPELALDLVDARWRYWRFTGRFVEGQDTAHEALRAARTRRRPGGRGRCTSPGRWRTAWGSMLPPAAT
ncbi:MAG: AAA family ATPase [Trueperaceae bacterium]|nr:AAA family ATPase [Trueperaceae bacterium]